MRQAKNSWKVLGFMEPKYQRDPKSLRHMIPKLPANQEQPQKTFFDWIAGH